MFTLFTLLSSLPFLFVFSIILLSSYLTPTPPPHPRPNPFLPTSPASFLPPPTTPHHRTLSPSDLGQTCKLSPLTAKTITSTSVCITVTQALNDAARPSQPKGILKRRRKKKQSSKPRPKPKTVSFALENNTTQLVDRWIRKVGFARYDEVLDVERWIEPHGRGQLSFPTTAFVRGGPDVGAEDDEGDVQMADA